MRFYLTCAFVWVRHETYWYGVAGGHHTQLRCEMHSMNDYYGPGMETYRVPGFLSILRLYIIVSYFRITVAGKLQIQVI